jgi:hypothetical protein
MHPVVFSRAWFDTYQRLLVTLLAWPLVGRVMRKVLAIRPCDIGWKGRIVALLPHAYTVDNGDGTFTTDFRTHAKYAKRLYHILHPVWQLAHWWDQCVANPLVPAWNLGFDSLTAYPDPNPETTSCDGRVSRYLYGGSESWATICAGDGNSFDNDFSLIHWCEWLATTTTDEFEEMHRSMALFDTAALGPGAVISNATLSVYGDSKVDPSGAAPNVDIYTASPASNTALDFADYGQCGTTSLTGAPIAYASVTIGGYNACVLNAAGIANIVTVGVSKFGFRNANYDVAGVSPAWASAARTYVRFSSADATGSAQDPNLVVTYTLPVNTLRGRITQRPRPFAPGIAR